MRLIILFVGLLSLLFFNSEASIIRQNYHEFSEMYGSCCFESGNNENIWGFEKTETCHVLLSNKKISQNNKRFIDSHYNLAGFTGKGISNNTCFKLIPTSKINLFLINLSSQSLWQTFLL
jgi:hypothetical protein